MKADDSSLETDQYRTVHEAARNLLDRADAWGTIPTPVAGILSAADLKLAPVSAFDEASMLRFLRRAGEQAERLLRRAMDKVLGIFDVHADVVHIDTSVSNEKQTFLTLHETGHKEIPHQRGIYRWVQDCSKHLAPEVATLFEREANIFATIVLFQDDSFSKMTADADFGIKVPINTARKFGASVYAGIREYVRKNEKICAAIVLEPPGLRADIGRVAAVRRIELSAEFKRQFGALDIPAELTLVDDLMRFVPLLGKRMSRPSTCALTDLNGEQREFVGEGFSTPYNTFLLIHAQTTLGRSFSVPTTNFKF